MVGKEEKEKVNGMDDKQKKAEFKENELQKILIELQLYKKKLDSINQQIQIVETTLLELEGTIKAIETLKNESIGKEILVSLGSGSYFKATLKDNKKVIVNVGAGISIEKTIEDAKKMLEERKEELKKTNDELQKNAYEINNKISDLNTSSERLVKDLRG